jgi:hypothetical protein
VVEAPVGFVVVNDEHGVAEKPLGGTPECRRFGKCTRAVVDRPVRVLGIASRRHDPGNLRECAARYVLSELVEEVLRPGQPGQRWRSARRNQIDDLRARQPYSYSGVSVGAVRY